MMGVGIGTDCWFDVGHTQPLKSEVSRVCEKYHGVVNMTSMLAGAGPADCTLSHNHKKTTFC